MVERIRFHLDENVTKAIALRLSRYGIDVTTTNEAGLSGQSDEAQFQFIQDTHRIEGGAWKSRLGEKYGD